MAVAEEPKAKVQDVTNEVKAKVSEVTNEVEVKVNEAVDKVETNVVNPIVEGVRKLVAASFGAVALTRDEVEAFLHKLVERGEIAQKDAEKVLKEFQGRLQATRGEATEKATETGGKIEGRVESGIETLLNRLNIPSKRDIDELSEKIAQLTVKVEQLSKTQK